MVQGNFCMVGTNSSGRHIMFCAQNYLEEYNSDGIRVLTGHLPRYFVHIDDERRTHYMLDTEQEVLSFYKYYLGLSAEDRAAGEGHILAGFLVHFANLNPEPAPLDHSGMHIVISHNDFPNPASSTQVRIEIRQAEQDIGTPQ